MERTGVTTITTPIGTQNIPLFIPGIHLTSWVSHMGIIGHTMQTGFTFHDTIRLGMEALPVDEELVAFVRAAVIGNSFCET